LKALSTVAVCLVVGCGAAPAEVLELSATGLVVTCPANPSFEDSGPSSSPPPGWLVPITSSPWGSGVKLLAGTNSSEGLKFVRLTTLDADSPAVIASGFFPVPAGPELVVVQLRGSGLVRLESAYVDGAGERVGSTIVSTAEPGPGWGSAAAVVNPPPGSELVKLSVALVGGAAGRWADVDAITCVTRDRFGRP